MNATVTNPAATSSVFPMTQIGNHVDKCWGYAGTFNYRADITALITGNGNYMVSGIPTNPPTAGNDMDGASIVIVYSDPTQLFTGHIVIGDGCQVGIGGQQTSNITGWNACANSTFANAFMIVGDLQNVGIANCFMNSAINNFNYPSASQDWWDNIVMNPAPNVTAGQNTTTFGLNSGGDCFNIVAAGLYYRTGCNVCTVGGMTVTTATTSSCTVGSATAFVTGGSAPYSYTWTPTALTTSAITNVPTGTYTVTVKDASGCLTGTAIALIPATNATIAVNSATICAGESATLTAQGGNTYTWTPNATLSSGNGNPVIATPAATTIYTVSTTNSLGCVGTTTATVVVNPLPVVTPTATSPVCSGNPINLGVGASTSYTWAGPNAFASNLQNPTIAPSTTLNSGNYSVTVTNASGCTASNVVNVLVNPTPTITPGNFGPYCAGATINLTVAAQSSYTWSGPNGFSSNAQNPAIANSQTVNSGIFSVTVSSAAGCIGTGTTNVIVNPKPTPTITSNSPLCQGSTLNLFANPAVSTYTWSGPNSFASNLQNPSVANVQTVNTGNYTVIVTTTAGCTGSATAFVQVNPTPTIAAGNTGPYCAGATINLTVSPSNTFTWTGPSAFSSNVQNPTIANSQTVNSGSYSVTIATAAGCTNNAVTNVVVNALPTPTATSNSPVCVGKPLNLTGLGGTTYTWTGPGGFSSNAQNPSIATASLANAGNYTLVVTNANGCTNSVVTNVVINTLPVIVVNSPTSCVGSSFTLTASGGTAYAWTGPNSYNSALQNPPFATASTSLNGNYTVVVTSAQGCTNNAVANVVVVTLPTVSIAGNNVICSQNFNSSINTTTLTASGANSYTWTLPTGFGGSPNLNTTPLVVTPSVTSLQTIATVSVIGSAGTCTSSAVFNLTINPNPTITVSSGSMCAGTSVNLTSSGASTYTWSPSTALNTTNGPNVIANPSVTTVYSVIGSSLGCNSQTQNGTATVVPNPTVTINPNPAAICLGNNINLTASGATTYTWSPNIALTTTLGPNTTANPTITTTYSVLGSQATCTHVAAITVSVLGLPSVTITPSSPTLCMNNFNGSPNTVTLNASGAASYTWGPIIGLTTNTLNGNSIIGTSNGAAAISGTVIGANGTCTNLATFTLNAIANPTIAVTSGSMCAGTSVTLTSSGASTYTWSPSTSLNTPNGNQVVANPAVTTVYSVIGSSVGCNSQTQTGTASVVPNPTVTFTPLTPTICLGNSVNLTASGATNYTWSPNTAITSTIGPNVTVNPTVTTSYTLIGEQATCTHVAVGTVSVISLPVVNVTPSSPTLCLNGFNGSPNTVSLTATGATSYTWGPIIGLNPNTTTGAMIIGTSDGISTTATGTVIGMVGTCTNVSSFTINAIPNPTITVLSATFCAGTSATLNASGASTFTWSPTASLNTANGPQVIANPSVTTIYSVIGSSVGCNSQTQFGTAAVVANPTVSIAPLTPSICIGGNINLTASGANNYTWSPNTAISSTTGANVTVSPTVTTAYTIIGEAATCTHSAVITVTVVNLPNVNINLNVANICMNNFNGSNNSLNITASGATTYNWVGFTGLAPNTLSGSNVAATALPPAIVGSGTVIGSASTCTNIATFSILIVPNPIVSIPTASMCFGKSAVLTASGASSYTWSPSSSLSSPFGSQVTATPAQTTIYSIVGTSLNCNSATQTTTVDVIPNPVISISSVTPTICAGGSIALTASGASSYVWTPSESLDNSVNPTVIASPSVTTNYVVVGTLNTCTTVAVRQVIVIPLPSLQAICLPSAICQGEQTQINANGANSYTWIPTIGLSNANSNFVIANPTISTVYSLVGNNGLCTATLSVPIAVIPKPVLNLVANNPRICLGNSSTIFASGAQGYSWTPVTSANMLNSNTALVTPSVTTNYTVTGYNYAGTVACAFTKEIEIEIVPQVTATINNSVAICQGNSVKLNAGGSNTYIWSPSTGLNNSLTATPYANPQSTTIYTVQVSNGGFCGATATVLVKVNPNPTVNAGPDQILNSDEPMYINAVGTGSLTWIFGEEILCRTCPTSQVMPKNSGIYRVEAINQYGCKAIDETAIEVTNYYNIYIPNVFTPNADGNNDEFLVYGTGITELQMDIFDRWGEKLYTSTDQLKGWNGYYLDVLCKNDVYVYLITFKTIDGKKHTKTGHVTILK